MSPAGNDSERGIRPMTTERKREINRRRHRKKKSQKRRARKGASK
jgi:hypothetical protein